MGELTNILGPFPEPGTKVAVVALPPAGHLTTRASWPAESPAEVVEFLRHAADAIAGQTTSSTGLILPGGAR